MTLPVGVTDIRVVQRRPANATTTHLVAARAAFPHDRFDERSLVESARHDANAFAELYRLYVERIYNYAFRRSGSTSIAEDVTSATFEKALRGLGTFRWKEPGIGPWLFRIASNELVNFYRSDTRQTRLAQTLATETPTSYGETSELPAVVAGPNDDVAHALAQIRPRYQRALTLRYYADLTNEEAAAAMGVSRATMAVIVHRGIAALRKAIESSPNQGVLTHER